MDIQPIKYHKCSLDQGEGVLLVDIESETIPRTDKRGNPQYYCLTGQHIFTVEAELIPGPGNVPHDPQNWPTLF